MAGVAGVVAGAAVGLLPATGELVKADVPAAPDDTAVVAVAAAVVADVVAAAAATAVTACKPYRKFKIIISIEIINNELLLLIIMV